MWFLFGVLIGSSLSGQPAGGGLTALGSIPIRCYMALEESAASYKRCRRASIIGELSAGSTTYPGQSSLCWNVWNHRYSTDESKAMCDIEWHLDLEVRTLTRLNELAAKQAQR